MRDAIKNSYYYILYFYFRFTSPRKAKIHFKLKQRMMTFLVLNFCLGVYSRMIMHSPIWHVQYALAEIKRSHRIFQTDILVLLTKQQMIEYHKDSKPRCTEADLVESDGLSYWYTQWCFFPAVWSHSLILVHFDKNYLLLMFLGQYFMLYFYGNPFFQKCQTY